MKQYKIIVHICLLGYSLFGYAGTCFGDSDSLHNPLSSGRTATIKLKFLSAKAEKQTTVRLKEGKGAHKPAREKQKSEVEKATDEKSAPGSTQPSSSSKGKKEPLPSFVPTEKIAPDHAVDFPADI